MIKKALLTTAGLIALSFAVFGSSAPSYVRTAINNARGVITNTIPLQFEIDRARNMVNDLVPEIKTTMQFIAQEEIKTEELTRQLASKEVKLRKERVYVASLHKENADPKQLAARFAMLKSADENTSALTRIHAQRLTALEAARVKCDSMIAARNQLKIEIDGLDNRLKMAQNTSTTNELALDDSSLTRLNELMRSIESKIQVEEKITGAIAELPEAPTPPEEVRKEVAQYLHLSGDEEKVADTK